MELYLIITIVGICVMSVVAFLLGKKAGGRNGDAEKLVVAEQRCEELKEKVVSLERSVAERMEEVKTLTSERDVQKANVANAMKMLDEQRAQAEQLRAEAQQRHAEDMARVKDAYDKQLAQVKSASDKQIETLKEMNKKQVEDQMALIREQMRTTSETVLKERQEELGKKNMEQVSKIVDPLQQSLKMMREALDDSKEKHQEALHKLDATIQANMKNSADLGETAARLTRALTGEVKVQGNFGELKLKQLLEDLGLKDGEQFSSQEHLRDSLGKAIKDDEG